MRPITTLFVLLAGWTASGCATGLQGVSLLATAGRGAATPAFSEFACEAQNYSADPALPDASDASSISHRDNMAAGGVSTACRRVDYTCGAGDALPVAPGPDVIRDLGTEVGPVAGTELTPQTGQVQLEPCPCTSDTDDSAPIAPGPEAIAEFALATSGEPACDTSPKIEPGHSNSDAADPQTDNGRFVQAPVAANPGALRGAQAHAGLGEEVYAEAVGDQTKQVEVSDASPEYVPAVGQVEVIPAPETAGTSPFRPGEEDVDADRFTRRVADVLLDIRPTEGVMPEDLAAAEFERNAQADPRQSHEVEPIFCSYTPWTICFRPLYFEEPMLERYGVKRRLLQPAASGVHFFTNVALLPYKMRVRPPRSCVCSNGFSRVGDCPPPGYGECVWRWDAALVEAAAVTGFVFILP